MITIIESSSQAWAIAATNGDLRIYSREQPGDWSEVPLSEDSEQIDQDGSLILEALYEQHAGPERTEEAEQPEAEADVEEEEPEAEAEEDEEPEAEADQEDEEPEAEAEDDDEPEAEEDEEPEEPEAKEEETEAEQKPRRRQARTTASRGRSKARAK